MTPSLASSSPNLSGALQQMVSEDLGARSEEKSG